MLICAGSSHKGGDDTHRSANGIVQGHAYTVLDCIVAPGGEHLIQLRNPWGVGGEWTGAYSEQDRTNAHWTRHAGKTARGESPAAANASKFWMPFHAFCTEFVRLYMCATFKSINTLELEIDESAGACGPVKALCKGCCTFFCCCEGAIAMWRPKRKSTFQVLLDCGLDVTNYLAASVNLER